MNVYVVGAYAAYLTISISLTVWVARTLVKNGRIFLVDSFLGNEGLADSVNHLLAVGFYLVNVGYVSLALKYGEKPADLAQAIESLSTKVGLVLLVLGVMHFLNLYVFSKMRAGPCCGTRSRRFPRSNSLSPCRRGTTEAAGKRDPTVERRTQEWSVLQDHRQADRSREPTILACVI